MACGVKLLHLSRIYRHHNAAPITVAVFARPNSLLSNARALNLAKSFQEEGYRLLLVDNDQDLILALQSGAADLVISDMTDVETIREPALQAKVPIIPVFGKDDSRSKAESRQYVASVKTPLKPDKFLDALDQALDSRVMNHDHDKAKAIRVSLR